MRVLLTGSQLWQHHGSVFQTLDFAAAFAQAHRVPMTLVHGKCYRGADMIGEGWARQRIRLGWPVILEPHPVDWSAPCEPRCVPGHRRARRDGTLFCPMLGMYRNEVMVSLGADTCVAMNRDNSSGTTNTSRLAVEAGIPLLAITWKDRTDVVRLAVPHFSALTLTGAP